MWIADSRSDGRGVRFRVMLVVKGSRIVCYSAFVFRIVLAM
jgi:hypothetical protein